MHNTKRIAHLILVAIFLSGCVNPGPLPAKPKAQNPTQLPADHKFQNPRPLRRQSPHSPRLQIPYLLKLQFPSLVSKSPNTPPDLATARAKIKHIVIIMQENRSFDEYFGHLSRRRWHPDAERRAYGLY